MLSVKCVQLYLFLSSKCNWDKRIFSKFCSDDGEGVKAAAGRRDLVRRLEMRRKRDLKAHFQAHRRGQGLSRVGRIFVPYNLCLNSQPPPHTPSLFEGIKDMLQLYLKLID